MKPPVQTPTEAGSAAAAPATGQTSGQAVYGQAHYDAGEHYVEDDPPATPVDDGGIVKLGTASMTDTEFLNFLQAENAMITGNPGFTTPVPSVAAMAAVITDLSSRISLVTERKAQWKEAANGKDAVRATAEAMIKTRATYVQLTSNGNTELILSTGFPVRSPNTPVGVLPAPLGLRVDLNGTIGKMILNWNAVPKARSYLVECAIAGGPGPLEWKLIEVGGKPTLTLNDRVVGVTYIFRVAAVGGTGGRSDWSAEVTRTAA